MTLCTVVFKDQKYTILIAEDSADDLYLLTHVLEGTRVRNPIRAVKNGKEAVAYLAGLGKYADRHTYPFPTILFLDWQMPKMGGDEVLDWLSKEPECRRLFVVVLTGLEDRQFLDKAYSLGANSFLAKPVIPADVENLIRFFGAYWLVGSAEEGDAAFKQSPLQRRTEPRESL